jgi:hypothetical protein
LLDVNKPGDVDVISSAQRWLSGRPAAPAAVPAVAPALPIAA